ncbi:hypothetical protein VNO80_14401 [Phaseolus coccineus]|uniref:Uncharacterized protein n=1 Tax=Phaseolus coccineus TaxID=3886 RepID=A0AAN9MID2_PHACN
MELTRWVHYHSWLVYCAEISAAIFVSHLRLLYERYGAIYVAFLLVKINRKKGQNEEKPLFSNPEAVGLIKVQTLMNNDECAWTNICGAFHGFLSFDNWLSPQDPLGHWIAFSTREAKNLRQLFVGGCMMPFCFA